MAGLPLPANFRGSDNMMMKCGHCGGKLRRVHRTLLERFRYLAIYECLECDTEQCVPRPYQYHFGPQARCPRCGTYRLSRLKGRDRIDAMRGGPVNFLKRLGRGKLTHCRYCRLQFYDRRPLMSAPEGGTLETPDGAPPAPEGQTIDSTRT
jgi:DNA-directed RNA polymerase subunit RPC12/RpoP